MAKKKWKKRLKKLAKAALIGGALYGGAKLLGRGKGAVSTAGQAVGVDRITPPSKYIQKKVVPDAVDTKPIITPPGSGGGGIHQGRPKTLWLEKQARAHLPKGSPGQINPWRPTPKGRLGDRLKGGGIAKRGTGAAYKSGGRTGKQFGGGLNRPVSGVGGVGGVGAPVRPMAYKHGGKVKSMGIAKRGGGVAKK